MMKKAWTIWFTGLHGAGKSTIAAKLVKILRNRDMPVALLDGDKLRKTISSDLGYSLEERNEHMKRVANICKIISENGVLTIASVASPTERSREYAKKTLKKMFLVYVKCPLEVCEKRDIKGHYKKAKEKEKGFENFMYVSSSYEEPKNPDIILNTDKESVEESVNKLLAKLKKSGVIKVRYI
ncbi:adenylyl-sulfate kinase [Candidatus Woesearchaeota archaeon]|nr:adenylyl-sulfate kinase [Candidatus Woesearchaeota archaeon]